MFQSSRNDYRISLRAKQRGIALLVMMTLILVAFTTIAISRLSQNSAEQKARARTTQALIQSRDAIMAFALSPANPTVNPPGTLPCPDGDGNGISDPLVASVCPNRRGLVPFLTLNIPQPLDGTGAPIWYVVANEYSKALSGATRNSSSPTALRLNNTLPMAFILLAPNKPILAQVRTNQRLPLASAVSQFLEGDNSDTTSNSYTTLRDDNESDLVADTQNDQVLGISTDDFWMSVEARVLSEVRISLETYHTKCNTYPFAADYSLTGQSTSNDSKTGTLEGRLPLNLALPTAWSGQCGTNYAPKKPDTWIATHWGDSLYYALCPQSTPNCIQLVDAGGNNSLSASALIMAPGVQLSTQTTRTPGNRNEFYELENALLMPANRYTHVKPFSHMSNINDVIYVVH